ncbi:MAG: MarR family transcriptional regulator [Oscillospiraceae bacterium]|nr:MarR family transcriptional regulator [Oscillospiraceae bacterium]
MEQNDSSLGFALYRSLMRLKRTGKRVPPPCKELSHFEFQCLHLIRDYTEEHPELPGLKASLLSAMTQTSRPAMSQHLNSMEEKGFLRRVTSRTDRRVTYLVITDQAAAFLAEAERVLQQHLDQICRELGRDDTARLIELFNKLTKILETQQLTPPDQKPL